MAKLPLASISLCFLLGACTVAIDDVRNRPVAASFDLNKNSESAALCVVRILDKTQYPVANEIRYDREKLAAEVIGRASVNTSYLINFYASPHGSKAEIRTPPAAPWVQTTDEVIAAVKTCQ